MVDKIDQSQVSTLQVSCTATAFFLLKIPHNYKPLVTGIPILGVAAHLRRQKIPGNTGQLKKVPPTNPARRVKKTLIVNDLHPQLGEIPIREKHWRVRATDRQTHGLFSGNPDHF